MADKKYRIGIDVGTHSVGFAAIELDKDEIPKSVLAAVSLIHDSGVDPDNQKSARTRLDVSGVARRTRRLYRRRTTRTKELNRFLESLGWPVTSFEEYADPYTPWKVRSELASTYIADDEEREEKLSIAIRHIANHRGWRNPYTEVKSLYSPGDPSDNFTQIRTEMEELKGINIPEDYTVGQLISLGTFGVDRLRGGGKDKDKGKPADQVKQALISARLHQIDHAREINKICAVQKIDDTTRKLIIDRTFAAKSPKGAQSERAGKDPLQPSKGRALKATDAFQRYRIASIVANLRIRDQGPLTQPQMSLVFDYLVNAPGNKKISWTDVAEKLQIDRGELEGTAKTTADFERAGNTPPVHQTNQLMETTKIKPLKAWWKVADPEMRRAMITALSNAELDDWDSIGGQAVEAFFGDINEDDHAELDKLHLPIGRAAYSEDTLVRLTNRMLTDGVDLHTAMSLEFNVASDWAPPAAPIGERVGNPAVDRVLKSVARFLLAAEQKWGAPEGVVVEHVRDGFMSESKSMELQREQKKNHASRQKSIAEMHERLGISGPLRRSDVWRYQSIQRQNCQCAYCGKPITYSTAEMDHIVPQAGPGSTNTRDNLVTVCKRCNQSKLNTPFAVWAASCGIPEVSVEDAVDRTRHWTVDAELNNAQFNKFRAKVVARLMRTSRDEPIDNRSLESVAWMANELHARIKQHFSKAGTKVNVYRGALTFEAREASGIADLLKFADGKKKSRLDRRHHAIDAAVITMIRPYVAEVLSIRASKQNANRINKRSEMQWREYTGETSAHRAAWGKWQRQMTALGHLLHKALGNDEVVVMSNLRLRPSNGSAHKETVNKLHRQQLKDPISAKLIDHAASEALWCALTRHPDFDSKKGLPEDPNRTIRVNGTHISPTDEIEFFTGTIRAVRVRDGWSQHGGFHHARIYKIPSGKSYRIDALLVCDHDLRKHKGKDVFNVEIPPQSISVRSSSSTLRRALREGTAEYLGWIIRNDEVLLSPDHSKAVQTPEAGQLTRWKVLGFESENKIDLKPLQLSAEGAPENPSSVLDQALVKKGLRPTANALFKEGNVRIIRRTTLGRERKQSGGNLPTSWEVT